MTKVQNTVSVTMRSKMDVKVGDTMLYPYSIEVAAGEPSASKDFHAMHHGEHCKVVGIVSKGKGFAWLNMKFPNGDTRELCTDFMVFVRPVRRKKEPIRKTTVKIKAVKKKKGK